MFKSIRWQILLSFAVLSIICVLFTGLVIRIAVDKFTVAQLKEHLTISANLVSDNISLSQKKTLSQLKPVIDRFSKETNTRITIIDLQGKVLSDSEKDINGILLMENHRYRPEIELALFGKPGHSIRYSNTLKINMLYVAVPIKENNVITGACRIALPLTQLNHLLKLIHGTILLISVLVMILSIIISLYLTNRISSPIHKITSSISGFSHGDFSKHIILPARYDEIGILAGTLNSMADKLQQLFTEIKQDKAYIHTVVDNMPEGILVTDAKGKITIFNPAMISILNINQETALNNTVIEVVRQPELLDIIQTVLKTKEKIVREIKLFIPEEHSFILYVIPFTDETGTELGMMIVLHNITEIRQLEQIRAEFTSNVSHELKTPLTAIRGATETLLEGALDDNSRRREFVEKIHNQTQRLSALIDDILELSKIESRRIPVKMEPVQLNEIIDMLLDTLKTKIEKHKLLIEKDVPVNCEIVTDKQKLVLILLNLLDNAVKFNKSGGTIKIEYAVNPDKHIISVIDTGAGIPEKDLSRIFERFYRVDKSRATDSGGTGLGLSIVKHSLELLNGEIKVESRLEKGTTFTVVLPKT